MIGLTAPKPVADVLAGPGRLSFLQGRQFCDPFPIIKLAGQLRPGTQVLLLHGSDDTTIPISHSKVRFVPPLKGKGICSHSLLQRNRPY